MRASVATPTSLPPIPWPRRRPSPCVRYDFQAAADGKKMVSGGINRNAPPARPAMSSSRFSPALQASDLNDFIAHPPPPGTVSLLGEDPSLCVLPNIYHFFPLRVRLRRQLARQDQMRDALLLIDPSPACTGSFLKMLKVPCYLSFKEMKGSWEQRGGQESY